MQPAEPMAKIDQEGDDSPAFPDRITMDMALAPQQHPFGQTHKIRPHNIEEDQHHVSQHSLSPEKLGVVGYVRDVAGFVKDVVHEARDRKSKIRRSSQDEEETPVRAASAPPPEQTSKPIETERARSPLVEAVTSLFPGVGDPNAAVKCTHTEELRNDMMQFQHNLAQSGESRLVKER
ncbi:hypothetical protein DFQ28_007092 [Apophysomyces sp. BC1034]|nr:hypothetical protein DFQ30_003058 [Apophysomyces sp. BC1015]KAG0181025.1 hypothetical protein DFQ29_009559 [Apophysomyces sp. BC1021]KAG0186934.1 hypothetical protein DFQ28_007092 [Apophysomyces sp. BC1034]